MIFMSKQRFETEYAGKPLIIETGELAMQANASCTVQYGKTMVLATAVMGKAAREGCDFFPLMVEYQEKFYAAGKIKKSRFLKREARPDDNAVLIGRMIDRGIRPLFDESIRRDIQIMITVLALDKENAPDVAAIIAASTVLHISDIPWNGPLAGIRVGKVENEWIANPTYEERDKSDINLILSNSADKVLMVECDMNEVPDKDAYEAFEFGFKNTGSIVKFIEDIKSKVGQEKQVISDAPEEEEEGLDENQKISEQEIKTLQEECKEIALKNIDKYLFGIPKGSKTERKETLSKVKDLIEDHLKEKQVGKDRRKKVMSFWYEFIDEQVTNAVLERDQRIDGRKLDEIRELSAKVGMIPMVHGSGLFMRGETQVMSIVTIGSPGDEQILDGVEIEEKKRYMHHYNFPPYSVGEASPRLMTSRRDIGHGALAEKALLPVLPSKEDFPYTVRVVSEVLGSNGSSSMGSTCGSTLALMDAGVPIRNPVAGIAIGVASNAKGEYKILTDIQDFEDGAGGMDFKVTGTRDGITAIQMDTKTLGLTLPMIKEGLEHGLKARIEIIEVIEKAIPEPRKEMSEYAPRITSFKIHPDKIRTVIGPGGKMINQIIDETGVQIDLEDDGTVMITSNDSEGSKKAVEWVKNLTQEAEIGKVYEGEVVRILDFGAFVEIFPGTDGMVHVSEITNKERVEDINKYLKVGQKVKVVVLKLDNGKISLSIKKVQ